MQPIIPSFRLLVLAVAFLITSPLAAQDFLAVADTICLELGSNDSENVLDNDFLPGPSDGFTIQAGGNECVRISPSGVVSLNPNAGTICCGEEFLFEYRILECEGQGCATTVLVQVKCPKPDCDLVDLDNLPSGNIDPSGEGQGHACLPACENSTATYYLAYQDGYSYDWSATNGTVSYTPAPPAEVSVTWGSLGPASLFLYRTAPDGLIDTVEYCVTLTPSPVADFDVTAITCLEQATQFFDNSTGAVSWYWDFGDGTSSTLPNPTHSYSSSGTYTVTLTVTSGGGTNPDGSPACCCSHTTTQQVTVDPLPGPNIYWISTLCAGDESVYWTDALGCGDYAWTVLDANGDPVPFSFVGSGMDSIVVDWGAGPSGTISLAVSGCPQQYCPQPTTVLVPIISTTGTIVGPQEVCRGATATYTLPKWPGVSYQWAVSGGTLVGDATGHTATVTWDDVGTGTLNVTYGSDFLAGLPNHEAGDCFGTAELDVDVLGSFSITDGLGGTGCLTGNSFIFATSDFPGATFTWTVADAGGAPVTSFTGQGSNAINIDWSGGSGTGTYTVTAVPLSPGPGDYCLDEQQLTIEVITVDPPSFTGPDQYCPGEPYNYAITAPDPSLLYQWSVTGGNIISGQNGPNPVIEWTSPTGGSLSVVAIQLSPIYCVSEPSTALMVTPLAPAGPLALDVTTACINSQQTYTLLPAQPAGATYSWSIVPATAGTIISGGDAPLVTIQWNNSDGSATLNATVTVCDQTLMLAQPLQLDVPTPATIVQSNDLCPGVTADLTANGGPYTNYSWSTGASGPAASTITISAGGAYSVTTTDANGCTAVASYVANELPGIDPFLSTGDPTVYCVGADGSPTGQSVSLVIPTTGSYDFDWYCNNVLQTGTTGATFVHPVTNSVGTFEYYAIVTDNTTGCQDTSNVITVRQIACGSGENCAGPSPNFTPIATNQTPDCSVVDLDVSMPPFVTATNWVLPAGSTVLSGSTSANSLDVRFPQAGCYSVTCEATVPNNSPPPANCVYIEIISVCVPVQADFTYTDDCGTVTFDNGTTFLDGTVITGYSWDFGDPGTLTDVSTAADPSYTYPAPGTYTVSLTVTTADGCQASFSQAITVGPALTPVITVAPGPYCVGDPISFSASATGAIQFTWDFGDGATFVGAMPQHAYSAPGNYPINVEVEDAFGCSQTTSTVVNVQPAPSPVTIAVAPDALLCPGESATLSVPAAAGISYSWSNGATGNSTTVSTAGTYDVTLTTGSGCTFVAEPVDISVLPAPPATITGNDVICDQGSTTLNGPAGPYSYAWTDGSGDPVGFGGSFLSVSTGPTFNPPYTLTVTDANGCSSVSAPFNITQTASPTVSISSMGSGCAGEPNVLTATSPTAGVSYTWSTGATGPTITVSQAGAYTVVVTDPQTGCTGSATFDIYPLPDLCVVPTGCYATCAPDTICGPVGEGYQYQWTYNGLPLAAGTDRCLEVSQPGSYSLAVTDANGCTAYSDSLYLEIEDCEDCADLATKLNPVDSDAGTCCFELYYDGLPDGVFAIQISTADGELSLVPGSVDPDLQEYLTPGGAIQVAPFTDPALPPTADQSVLTFCVEDPTTTPQQILIEYLDADLEVVCSDTLETDCAVEPDCLYALSDTLTCGPENTLIYTGTFCNPADALFAVEYLQFLALSPAAMGSLPQGIMLDSPLLPGECTTVTLTLNATEPGSEFCYSVVAHSANPDENPGAVCCEIEEELCLKVPDCDPCDDLGVVGAKPLSPNDSPDDCCYAITLFNEVTEPALTSLELCVIEGMADLTAYTSLGGDWIAETSADGQSVSLTTTAGPLPVGTFELPPLCLSDVDQPYTQVAIKWLAKDSIVCRDTLELFCEPDCGYLVTKEIGCQDGQYVWAGELFNTSGYEISEAYLAFDAASGLTAYNQTLPFSPAIPDGGSQSLNFSIGSPAGPGDTICFTVTLHELDHDEFHLNCCQFETCIVLPDCEIEQCACDEKFFAAINEGFTAPLGSNNASVTLNPVVNFGSCDEINWLVRTVPGDFDLVGTGYDYTYSFPANDSYEICMEVVRTLPNGETCSDQSCRTFEIGGKLVEIYPNPSFGMISISFESEGRQPLAPPQNLTLQLFNNQGQAVARWRRGDLAETATSGIYSLDLAGLPPGVYLLRGQGEHQQWTRRILLLR